MALSDLLDREPPVPWADGAKLPWDECAFSARMLREHLSQEHDRASRRFEVIDRHVTWIDNTVLGGKPGRVLDLGCGPGLYTTRLARLGHTCVGIDFSPASIAHAQTEAQREGLSCEYRLQDLREGHFGSDFQAVLLLFGDLNTFSPLEAQDLLAAAGRALAPSGVLVLEVHTDAFVREVGRQPATWFTAPRSLFSERPHVCLRECAWHADLRATTERFFVIDAETAEIRIYVSTTQACSSAEYDALVRETGFGRIDRHPSLEGAAITAEADLFVLVAWRDAG